MNGQRFVVDLVEIDSDPPLDANIGRPVVDVRRHLDEHFLVPGCQGDDNGNVAVVVVVVPGKVASLARSGLMLGQMWRSLKPDNESNTSN